eukprot:snap_masked-scaffold_5-processed-gene-1.30-mRNA-1 protein AED:1.00 eAED:1.00 QI:0/-1/0/0/-1/1/1/0/65
MKKKRITITLQVLGVNNPSYNTLEEDRTHAPATPQFRRSFHLTDLLYEANQLYLSSIFSKTLGSK